MKEDGLGLEVSAKCSWMGVLANFVPAMLIRDLFDRFLKLLLLLKFQDD